MIEKKSNILDIIRTASCILIIGSHVLPLFRNEILNYYYGQWFFRFCVPLFFMVSGFYFHNMTEGKKRKYIKRIALLYVAASILYLPIYATTNVKELFANLIFGYNHLWYLSALTVGLVLVYFAGKYCKGKKYVFGLFLLGGGIFFDEYYRIFPSPFLVKMSETMAYVGGARHALMFAVPMLLIGEWISETGIWRKIKVNIAIVFFLLTWVLAFVESIFLRHELGNELTTDLSIFGWMPACALVVIGLRVNSRLYFERSRSLRKIIDVVCVIHIWVAVLIRKIWGTQYFLNFVSVTVISFACAYVWQLCSKKIRKMYRLRL